jgi:hypothetical protein
MSKALESTLEEMLAVVQMQADLVKQLQERVEDLAAVDQGA